MSDFITRETVLIKEDPCGKNLKDLPAKVQKSLSNSKIGKHFYFLGKFVRYVAQIKHFFLFFRKMIIIIIIGCCQQVQVYWSESPKAKFVKQGEVDQVKFKLGTIQNFLN